MMHKNETFDFLRKAGIVLSLTSLYMLLCANLDLDWDLSLKLNVQQEVWNWDALGQFNNEADDVIDYFNKQQQRKQFFLSSNTLQLTMLPSAALSQFKQNAVKTSCSDFTIDLCHFTISNALMKHELSKFKVDNFLKGLQHEQKLYLWSHTELLKHLVFNCSDWR